MLALPIESLDHEKTGAATPDPIQQYAIISRFDLSYLGGRHNEHSLSPHIRHFKRNASAVDKSALIYETRRNIGFVHSHGNGIHES